MKTNRLCALVAVGAMLAVTMGCINSETLIKVNADGSGTIVETMTMNPEAIKQMAKQMGGEGGESSMKMTEKKEPFSEAEAKAKVAQFGQGVTFVSAEPIDTKEAKGMRVTYAFKDVTKLNISQKPAGPGPAGAGEPAKAADEDQLKFAFARLPNGNSLLTIHTGGMGDAMKKGSGSSAPAAKQEETPPEMLEMMKGMFKGLRIAVLIDVDGKIVKTNSPYVSGSSVTILDINFEALMNEEDKLKQLDSSASIESMKAVLKDVKGIKVNLDPDVKIEFTGR
ncbi:MAG: hypothetical protein AB1714_13740 [Acidobacteriota bacterium]